MSSAAIQPSFRPCTAADFEEALAIRITALHPLLVRLGRADPADARKRMEQSFHPECSQFILHGESCAGFYTFRRGDDGFHLEHFYILPEHQGRGLGTVVLRQLIAWAEAERQPIYLGTARGNRAADWYERHGFKCTSQGRTTCYYVRQPFKGTQAG